MTFTAIDFETAISHHICAVGIVIVENRVVVEEFSALIQPPNNYYNWYTTKVHGITAATTKNAPTFIDIYPEIKKRLQNRTVVAHNESFDRNTLLKTMRDFGIDYSDLNIPNKWECTMRYCRKIDKYPSAKLNVCCEIEGIPLNHHDALSDAKACAELYLRVKNR
jgi:DNA polymerase III subunit epsilon